MTTREKSRILSQSESPEIQYPIQLKRMTKEETKEYHLKKLQKLSEESVRELPQLDEPTDEQHEWIFSRLSSDDTWPKVNENKNGDTDN